MNPEQRAEIESQVERALRRGELARAREGLSSLCAAFPDDEGLALRLTDLEESALPGELTAPRPPALSPPPPIAAAGPLHVAEGERLFHRGDFLGAVAAYRQALREQPHSELLQERLVELYQLAQAASPVRTASVTAVDPAPAPASAPAAELALEGASEPAAQDASEPTTAPRRDATPEPEPERDASAREAAEASGGPGADARTGAVTGAVAGTPQEDRVAALEALLSRIADRRRRDA